MRMGGDLRIACTAFQVQSGCTKSTAHMKKVSDEAGSNPAWSHLHIAGVALVMKCSDLMRRILVERDYLGALILIRP